MARKRSTTGSKSRSAKGGRRGKKWFTGNVYTVMLFRLLVVLLLMFLSRILFYLFNLGYYSGISIGELLRIFLFGLRFDISALLIINLPYIVMNSVPFRFRLNGIYQGIANGYFYLINALALMTNFGDTIYFRFTLKRLTADFLNYVGVGGDFDKLIPQFLKDFWYVAIAWVVFVALLVWLATRFSLQPAGKSRGGAMQFFVVNLLIFLVVGALTVIGIRGGFQLRPINLVTAGSYTSAKNIPLILNTPFSVARTFNDDPLKSEHFFKNEKEVSSIYTPVHRPAGKPVKPLNVVILILESFSSEHIGALNHKLENGRYQGFTPFFDSLIRQGYYFDAFANGKTSIQGIPAILSAIPSLMNESFIQSSYAAGKYASIAGLLKNRGYAGAFFHGGTNGSMGFDTYTKLVGFDHYFGRTEYGNEKDYDGKWGIRDEEFLQFTARKLNDLKQPFVGAVFTLSSHHPYSVPGKYANVFRKGKLPIQQSVMYADYAMAKFFHTAKQMPWYDNTLFVITADHTSEGYYPYYQTNVGQYAIPLLFFYPGGDLKGMSPRTAQQTDIMPTVLNYLGYPKSYVAFGADLFDTTTAQFSIHYISGLYGLIKEGYYMEFDGTRTTALFDLKADPLQKKNIAATGKREQERLELFIKAYIQQYNNRLIENRLWVD